MTRWELAACIDGYNSAHGPEQSPKPPTDEEFARMKLQSEMLH